MPQKEYDFVQVYLKRDVALKLAQICIDAKHEQLFISKSDLLRAMLNNGTIVEYAIKHIIYDKTGENWTWNFPARRVKYPP